MPRACVRVRADGGAVGRSAERGGADSHVAIRIETSSRRQTTRHGRSLYSLTLLSTVSLLLASRHTEHKHATHRAAPAPAPTSTTDHHHHSTPPPLPLHYHHHRYRHRDLTGTGHRATRKTGWYHSGTKKHEIKKRATARRESGVREIRERAGTASPSATTWSVALATRLASLAVKQTQTRHVRQSVQNEARAEHAKQSRGGSAALPLVRRLRATAIV